MDNELDTDFKEYLSEYQLQAPIIEAHGQYEEGELEAEWLIAAGFPQLTEPFEEGRELKLSELEPILSSLTVQHAEAINQRVRALNRTVRGRTRSRFKRKPDIRDVFRDFDESSVGTRSRSATPDSLDSITGEEGWSNTLLPFPNTFEPNADIGKQKLRRTPSAPLRGSAELFRGTHIRCDIPFYSGEGVELLGFQKIGTVHIPRIRSGSDPYCSIGRERGSQITASRSVNNLLAETRSTNEFVVSSVHKSTEKQSQKNNTSSLSGKTNELNDEPISFESFCRQTNQNNTDWGIQKELSIDINEITESNLKKLQQFCWLELAALFDKYHVVLDKRKPFKRKRKEEGNLFGVSLNALVRRDQQVTGEDSTLVPLIIQIILNELTTRGGKEEGILRVPGHKQKTENLYNELEAVFYQKPEKVSQLLGQSSVHDLSALLKRILRELPQPLLANDLIHLFYQTHEIPPPDQYKAISMLFLLLPHENRNTTRAILSFLNIIIGQENFNKMSKHNVATIFAPSFFPPRFIHPADKNNIEAQVKMAAKCCDLTKVFISQSEFLFRVPLNFIENSKLIKSGQGKRYKSKGSEKLSETVKINPSHVHRLVI